MRRLNIFLICYLGLCLRAHAVTCPTDFTDHTGDDILVNTFMAPVGNRCTDGAYELKTIPDTFVPLYRGFTDGATVPLCDDGYLSGNTCVPFAQNNCRDDYYREDSLYASTFMAPVGNRCTDGAYDYRTGVTDLIYPIYNGFVEGATATLCGAGKYLANGNTCTEYVQSDCPTDFVDISTNATLFGIRNAGHCGADYADYVVRQQCDENTTDSVCAVLCSGGLQYTDIGTCATLCNIGMASFNMRQPGGPTISFPLYSTQQSNPTLAFGLNGGVCYGNLVDGAENGTLNLRYNGATYHLVR